MRCHFIPPYLLRRIVAGAEDRRAGRCGEATLALDGRLRAAREAARGPDGRRRPGRSGTARIIHTANNTETLPGEVARSDGDPPVGDPAVDEAFDSSGQVLDMFAAQFGRRSVDGRGSTVSITVHYGRNYDNAFWDGRQLVFGDGDGVIFDRFTKPTDVMAHEFTHGVTQFTAGLAYQDQSGALNESISDVFAAMAKQFVAGQTRRPGRLADRRGTVPAGHQRGRAAVDARTGNGVRRPADRPGSAGRPDGRLRRDRRGQRRRPHQFRDSQPGVRPGRAGASAASAGSRVGQVWYDTLTAGELTPRSDFAAFAQATLNSAARRFPGESDVADAVRRAWQTVGVLGRPAAIDQGEADPGEPATRPVAPETVAVRRSGGFAGGVRSAELDLNADPEGPRVRQLLLQVSVQQLSVSQPTPDRFVYSVRYGSWQWTVGEDDLTPELRRVVQIVLARGG